MQSIDHYRQTPPPGGDIPGLGRNPRLAALNAASVRSQLSMADAECLATQRRAALILLRRIADYYQVAGYVPPIVTKSRNEVGMVLGPWLVSDSGYQREQYPLLLSPLWQEPEKVFKRARFLSADAALRLAQWECEQEVPESTELLELARRAALSALQSNRLTSRRWVSSRRNFTTKQFVEHIIDTAEQAEKAAFVAGKYSGEFVPAG